MSFQFWSLGTTRRPRNGPTTPGSSPRAGSRPPVRTRPCSQGASPETSSGELQCLCLDTKARFVMIRTMSESPRYQTFLHDKPSLKSCLVLLHCKFFFCSIKHSFYLSISKHTTASFLVYFFHHLALALSHSIFDYIFGGVRTPNYRVQFLLTTLNPKGE